MRAMTILVVDDERAVRSALRGPGPGSHDGFGPGFGFQGGAPGLMGPRA